MGCNEVIFQQQQHGASNDQLCNNVIHERASIIERFDNRSVAKKPKIEIAVKHEKNIES